MSLNRNASERGVRLHACEPPARTKSVYTGLHLMRCLHLRCRERPAAHPQREWLRSAHWTSQRFPDPEGHVSPPVEKDALARMSACDISNCALHSSRVISRTAPCRALTGSCCARRLPLLQRRAPRLGPLGSPAAPSRDAGEALCARSSRVRPISGPATETHPFGPLSLSSSVPADAHCASC